VCEQGAVYSVGRGRAVKLFEAAGRQAFAAAGLEYLPAQLGEKSIRRLVGIYQADLRHGALSYKAQAARFFQIKLRLATGYSHPVVYGATRATQYPRYLSRVVTVKKT
jgi:hypothetical protein